MVYGCVDNSSPDSTILHVLKVLLTAVASKSFRVHGEPMLGAIRVYNIALNRKSPINQATAKAMLTQMISIIFRRMESDQARKRNSINVPDGHSHTEGTFCRFLHSDDGEIAMVNQDEGRVTLEDPLSNQEKGSSPAIVEVLQNLAGGADIKQQPAAAVCFELAEEGKRRRAGGRHRRRRAGGRQAENRGNKTESNSFFFLLSATRQKGKRRWALGAGGLLVAAAGSPQAYPLQ
ncbi:Brefeldin A-inhibited guanine nucleotide-exchange protein 5 [Apostasia shenzhenica]|uniref:Brefeldin A-inhibited guanine nucleotide-exchange protein 5 n=1 Tax=Apostasia shenzhenica TaxID=1088818 RepID=A0A2I0A934_9ASPA|nr:Brefeldin A-inhibited guanine nucleotide-exchange protein 5 [Apostasia shenzhenica]